MQHSKEDTYLKKELYELIKSDETIFDFIQESSLDGLWYWDLEHPENEWMNARFWTTLGYNPDDMPHTSRSWQHIIDQDDLQVALDNFTKHLADPHHPYDQIVRYTHRNGSIVWIQCRGLAIRDNSGKPVRMLGAHHDITSIKQTESEILKAKERAEESEEKFRLLHEHAGIGIGYYTADGVVLSYNQLAAKLMNGTPEDFIGKSIYDIFPKEPADFYFDRIKKAAISEEPMVYEDFVHLPAGDRWFLSVYAKIENSKREVAGIQIVSQDISEIKSSEIELQKAKERVEESEEKYRAMYNNAPLSYQSLDENGCFLDINPMWMKTLGYEREEVIGKWYGDFLHPDFVEHFRVNFPAFKKRGYVSDVQFKLRKKDGTFIDVSFEGCIGYTPEGKFKQTYCVFKDITDQKAIERELIRAKEKAEAGDRLKTAFLQNMSHEIRTPMNAIMGFSSLLPDCYNDREKLDEYSRIIELRGSDLLNIINDILDISKIESGQNAVHVEDFNIAELFDELTSFFDDYSERIGKQHINVSFLALPDEAMSNIKTDKLKLKQIIINLVGNALKFTETGSVSCGYTHDGDKLQFYVSDTGVGIPASKYDYVFERFSQIKHPSLHNVGGTGLGLPIVKGLVGLLGGNVWLESQVDKGTTFYFTIEHIAAEFTDVQHTPSRTHDEIVRDRSILIVEDDEYNAEYLKVVLRKISSNIIAVPSGLAAVAAVREKKIDIILMDVRLPDISGYEAVALILQDQPTMKIIAQTAYAASSDRQKAIDAGCVDYISKPTKRDELIAMILKYLR